MFFLRKTQLILILLFFSFFFQNKEFVYLMPKLEYQVGFGHEQTTISDASQMWISSLIRHNCSINRSKDQKICLFSVLVVQFWMYWNKMNRIHIVKWWANYFYNLDKTGKAQTVFRYLKVVCQGLTCWPALQAYGLWCLWPNIWLDLYFFNKSCNKWGNIALMCKNLEELMCKDLEESRMTFITCFVKKK